MRKSILHLALIVLTAALLAGCGTLYDDKIVHESDGGLGATGYDSAEASAHDRALADPLNLWPGSDP